MVTQVQGNQEDLLIPDGVDTFPWHRLLAKCFVKQTHDLKDFASVGSSKKNKNKKSKTKKKKEEVKRKKYTLAKKKKFCSYLKVIS